MSQENVDALRRGYEALNRGDVSAVLTHVHPEVEFVPLVGNLDGRIYRGHEGMTDYVATMRSEWEQIGWDVRRLEEVDAGRVLAVVRMHGRSHRGISVDQEVGVVAEMHDGRATRLTTYPNAAEALEAVGLAE
jgi:ketosteroid isomerase-like protein